MSFNPFCSFVCCFYNDSWKTNKVLLKSKPYWDSFLMEQLALECERVYAHAAYFHTTATLRAISGLCFRHANIQEKTLSYAIKDTAWNIQWWEELYGVGNCTAQLGKCVGEFMDFEVALATAATVLWKSFRRKFWQSIKSRGVVVGGYRKKCTSFTMFFLT